MADYRLDGRNPLGYMGTRPYTPPQMIVMKRAPTSSDYIGFPIGTQWTYIIPSNPTASNQYVLVLAEENVATWIPLKDGGELPTLPLNQVALGTGSPGITSVGSLGNLGQLLTSQGAGLPPIWTGNGGGTGLGSINTIVIDTPGSGTYTPSANMTQCIVECIGGGASPGQVGGSGGSYAKRIYTASTIGLSQNYYVANIVSTILNPNFNPTNGQNTTFGTGSTLITAGGGQAGSTQGGSASGGNINIVGGYSTTSYQSQKLGSGGYKATLTFGGIGGNSGMFYGPQTPNVYTSNDNPFVIPGYSGSDYGSGASCTINSDPTTLYGTGAQGLIIITEYIAA